jgi:hypothetical protein
MKKRFGAGKIAGFILIGIAAIALFTFVVMSLWNAILVPVIHVSAVSFWQAAGILLLSKILFGGFRGGGRRFGGPRFQMRHDMKEKWQNMTPEEKEKMKQEWRQRCNRWGGWQNAETAGQRDATQETDR